MKKILILFILMFCIVLVGCTKREIPFKLEEEYYESNEFVELNYKKLEELIENKKSFGLFIYQPLCTVSYEFNKVLVEFSNKYQLTFYKMPFSEIKNTELEEYIKYYPSFILYRDGELVDYLESDKDDDLEYYKNIDGFESWFTKYIIVTESISNTNSSYDEIDEEIKIDTKLDNVTYDKNKVNIYFFWGNGCPHCEKEFDFFESIETEFGDYFNLHTFEVWYDEENAKLLDSFASKMGDEVKGVPYTIIGKETFIGYSSSKDEEMIAAIREQYQNSYDVYFDNYN